MSGYVVSGSEYFMEEFGLHPHAQALLQMLQYYASIQQLAQAPGVRLGDSAVLVTEHLERVLRRQGLLANKEVQA